MISYINVYGNPLTVSTNNEDALGVQSLAHHTLNGGVPEAVFIVTFVIFYIL